MKLKFGRRSLAVVVALIVVVAQLARSEPPVNASVFEASSETGYAEIWVPHQQFTGGITNVNTCADTKPNNSWYIEPFVGCPKTVSVTLPGDTTTATSAELYLDIWAGREANIVRYSINGGATQTVNAGFDASRSPVVLAIPVADLQNGSNEITFSVNNSKYHIHDASIRLYGVVGSYADTGSLTTVGGIAAGTGGTLDVTNTETVTITANVPGADRVEFIAYYDGLDEDNDGDTTDWHAFTRMNFQPGGKPNSGYSIPTTGGTIGHIGTDLNDGDDNYSIDWDTSLVASQSGVKIKARAITEDSGTRLDVVDAVGGESANFTISRTTYIVEYFRDNDFVDGALREGGGEPDQLTRDMELPADQTDWQSATMLGLFWGAPDITWNGGTTERSFTFLNNGNPANDDVWDISVVELDLNDLVGGENDIVYDFDAAAFPFGNQVEEPGPLLVVKRAGGVRIYDQPESGTALDGQPVTLNVVVSALGTITYQWSLDSVDIPGANNSSYTFTADVGDGVSQDYRVEVTAGGSITSQVATVAVVENAFVADDFSNVGASQALWEEVDATGDATFTYTGAQGVISIPEDNESHQPWIGGNNAGVLRQPMSDSDFDLHAAFESVPSERFTLQGVVVGGSGDPYLRFDVYFDGANLRPFAAAIDGNSPITFINGAPLNAADAKHLRVRRIGDEFTMFTSADGTAWTQRGQFTYEIDVIEFGPYGGTAVDTVTAPEFHAIVDFVVEVPDGAAGDDVRQRQHTSRHFRCRGDRGGNHADRFMDHQRTDAWFGVLRTQRRQRNPRLGWPKPRAFGANHRPRPANHLRHRYRHRRHQRQRLGYFASGNDFDPRGRPDCVQRLVRRYPRLWPDGHSAAVDQRSWPRERCPRNRYPYLQPQRRRSRSDANWP
ncbi:MAG: hypothetical protein GXP35_07080 [Actinobacteria bacterium]|nr:hypothetical protein [Actinomycetota bacterium]